ncbi:hypothetical protein BJY04DRAFT_221466 [Aspergillus karnatakaensis]|uniref:fungal specific transcription factor domain-containing protein n=1 Tax=Aspergillus karnatakaensis TaxID=1810916 RepID=UPI003CCCD7D3
MYQGRISHHLYPYSHPLSTRSVRQILLDTAELDRGLLSWVNQIPAEFRPENSIICSQEQFHIVAFLSIEYHGAMIALHRAALIAPKWKMEAEVMKHCMSVEDATRFRLSNGGLVCVESARAIAKLSIELQDRGLDTCLIPTGTAVLACIALAIYLMKHPDCRLQTMDLHLLRTCLAYSSTRYAQCKIDHRFLAGLGMIYTQVQARLDSNISAEAPNGATPQWNFQERGISQLVPATNPIDGQPATLPPDGPTTPFTWHVTGEDRTLQNAAAGRDRSFSHPGPDVAINWPPGGSGPQPQDGSLDRGVTAFLDGLPGSNSNDVPIDLDEAFLAETFNVEDLWNWMSYVDSPLVMDMM